MGAMWKMKNAVECGFSDKYQRAHFKLLQLYQHTKHYVCIHRLCTEFRDLIQTL